MRPSLVRERTEERARSRAYLTASGAGGRWFESSHPDYSLQGATFPGSLFFFVLRATTGPSEQQIINSVSVGIEVMNAPGRGLVSGAGPIRSVYSGAEPFLWRLEAF